MFRYFRQTNQFGVRNIKLVELLNYLWWVSPSTSQSTKHRIGVKGRGSRETSFGDFGSEIWLDCFVDWFIFLLELWWYFFIFLFLYFIFICLFWKAIDAMLDWFVAKSVSLVSSSLLFMSKVYVCKILISQWQYRILFLGCLSEIPTIFLSFLSLWLFICLPFPLGLLYAHIPYVSTFLFLFASATCTLANESVKAW